MNNFKHRGRISRSRYGQSSARHESTKCFSMTSRSESVTKPQSNVSVWRNGSVISHKVSGKTNVLAKAKMMEEGADESHGGRARRKRSEVGGC